MPTIINANKSQLYKKIILQIVLIIIFVLSIVIIIHPFGQPLTLFQLLLMILFAIAFLVFNAFTLVQLLYLPSGVSVDETAKKMEVKFLLIKPVTIEAADLEKYTTTTIFGRKKDYEGILIYIKAGKKLLISNINVKDYKPVEAFLKKIKVKHAGKEDFGFFPYYKQWL